MTDWYPGDGQGLPKDMQAKLKDISAYEEKRLSRGDSSDLECLAVLEISG
jgi:hypothetical protein